MLVDQAWKGFLSFLYQDKSRSSMVHELFRHLDSDGSGSITIEELAVALEVLGLNLTVQQQKV